MKKNINNNIAFSKDNTGTRITQKRSRPPQRSRACSRGHILHWLSMAGLMSLRSYDILET